MNGGSAEIDSDVALLARCRAGDATSWKQLYDSNFTFVERICRRLGTPDAELDDVVQDTFLIAFKKLDDFDQGRVSTWLYRIAANLVSSRHRRRRIRGALLGLFTEPPPVPAVDRAYDAREAQAQVAAVLERMAPKKREVFALFELDGMSGDEIAERIGCKVETVWSRLHYARQEFERIARKRGLP
ncbi:MAG: sigma-70 family RNA polymerase sigma factor [Archangiaceae bacterium]|nr:sigma-70 family RNA polymerase sigma factor [Archangiaceae bacterium]